MKAITTTYKGATNTKPAKLIATDQDRNRVSINYPSELNSNAAHRKAAQALCDKMQWSGILAQGSLNSSSEVFVFIDGEPLIDAVKAIIPDLEHYVSKQGPGPDRRLATLKAILD